jgi:hypothetical protein
MPERESIFLGNIIADDNGRLRACGLVGFISNFAQMDSKGRPVPSGKPKRVAVRADFQIDKTGKRKVVGGDVICTYNDGIPHSFKLGMANSVARNPIIIGAPETIEISPDNPSRLSLLQREALGPMLKKSSGKQHGLRERLIPDIAERPVISVIGAGLGVAIGAATSGANAHTAVASGLATSFFGSAVEAFGKHRQEAKARKARSR